MLFRSTYSTLITMVEQVLFFEMTSPAVIDTFPTTQNSRHFKTAQHETSCPDLRTVTRCNFMTEQDRRSCCSAFSFCSCCFVLSTLLSFSKCSLCSYNIETTQDIPIHHHERPTSAQFVLRPCLDGSHDNPVVVVIIIIIRKKNDSCCRRHYHHDTILVFLD